MMSGVGAVMMTGSGGVMMTGSGAVMMTGSGAVMMIGSGAVMMIGSGADKERMGTAGSIAMEAVAYTTAPAVQDVPRYLVGFALSAHSVVNLMVA